MRHEEIKQKISSLCLETFQGCGADMDVIDYLDFVDDLGMDSITFIKLIIEIETCFGIIIPDDMLSMENFKNLNEIVQHLESIEASNCNEGKEQVG